MRELPLTIVGQNEKTNACGNCSACCEGPSYMPLNIEEAGLLSKTTRMETILPATPGHKWNSFKNRREAIKILGELGVCKELYTPNVILRELGRGEGFYRREESCGWLNENGDCSIYDERPEICRKFQKDSFGCKKIRLQKHQKPTPA